MSGAMAAKSGKMDPPTPMTLTLTQHLRPAVMDIEFVNYSQIKQQESFTPENIWVVSTIAGSEELTMTAVHGPSGVKVSGIPVTQELLQSFGSWVTTIRGGLCIGGTDRALVRKAFPNLYDQSLHDMTEKYREVIHTMSKDDELIFHGELAQQWQWEAGE